MAAPRKYPDELRERAVRLAVDARKDPVSRPGACRRIGQQLGINPETLRGWVTQAEIDDGVRPGTTSDDAARLAADRIVAALGWARHPAAVTATPRSGTRVCTTGPMWAMDDASLRALLPPCAQVSERRDDRDPEILYPQEREYLARAVPKRRTEFVTTRRCVRDALSGLGVARPPMVPGAAGSPSWPRGVVGSITHCQGYRAAVVARAADVCAVGVDAEPAEGLPPGVLDVVAEEGEIERLRELSTRDPDVPWDRLLFSAKEAVYKVWFPLSRTWLGFEEVDVTLEVSGRFTAVLARTLSLPGGVAVEELSGRWATDCRHLLSAVTVLNEAMGPSADCRERHATSWPGE